MTSEINIPEDNGTRKGEHDETHHPRRDGRHRNLPHQPGARGRPRGHRGSPRSRPPGRVGPSPPADRHRRRHESPTHQPPHLTPTPPPPPTSPPQPRPHPPH